MADDKKELYRWIKIGGILSFIPFVLLGGALLGYLLADYLDKKVIFAPLIVYPVSIAIGMLASVVEVIRIIKLAVKISESR
ncbi:MAG: hypothetical protein Q8O12_02850 [Candidatus Omnitrophota bacterium]|nr:hypothetical protein [Candidatus Omnitrophota bacterium]